jgi:predicted dehydrogenase
MFKEKISLGVWGLGRGADLADLCSDIDLDVVAGCDRNENLLNAFRTQHPRAFCTADSKDFLEQDFEAVIVATDCPEHGSDSLSALRAGKHVLSEVTAFHTMAEGVELVEETERSGRVYNLAENYAFSKINIFLAEKYRAGLFGELQYAEFEYLQDQIRGSYTFADGSPLTPGHTVHTWRSWLNNHYYNTHALGPVLFITGLRPVQLVSFPVVSTEPGKLSKEADGVATALITLSGGGVVRTLVGGTSNRTFMNRLWGSLGSAESNEERLLLRLGSGGNSLKLGVTPKWPQFGALADKAGHRGGDFWTLYFFAREIRERIPAPFDVYRAADCACAGILAFRSQQENGKVYMIPDFRSKGDRNRWRNDRTAQTRYDGVLFPPDSEKVEVGNFTRIMKELITYARLVREVLDWINTAESIYPSEIPKLVNKLDELLDRCGEVSAVYRAARHLSAAYPANEGARLIVEMLDVGYEEEIMKPEFKTTLENKRVVLKKIGER